MFKKALLFGFAAAAIAGAAQAEKLESIVVAGGCYWCVESDFEGVKGVKEAVSGFAGGDVVDPTYKQVTGGGTGHYEAVKITYDADVVSKSELYDFFFRTVDPLDAGGQFCDRGDSYRTAIFATNAEIATAQAAKNKAEAELGQKTVTPILKQGPFYLAGSAHQDYYKKKPIRYNYYRSGCGRDKRVEAVWGSLVTKH